MRTNAGDLTKKQREWLGHIQAIRRSGQSVSAYANRHSLLPHQLYTWTTRLRRLGVLEAKERPGRSHSKRRSRSQASPSPKRTTEPVHFTPVELVSSPEPSVGMRIRLANGVILELEGSIVPEEATLRMLASLP